MPELYPERAASHPPSVSREALRAETRDLSQLREQESKDKSLWRRQKELEPKAKHVARQGTLSRKKPRVSLRKSFSMRCLLTTQMVILLWRSRP